MDSLARLPRSASQGLYLDDSRTLDKLLNFSVKISVPWFPHLQDEHDKACLTWL